MDPQYKLTKGTQRTEKSFFISAVLPCCFVSARFWAIVASFAGESRHWLAKNVVVPALPLPNLFTLSASRGRNILDQCIHGGRVIRNSAVQTDSAQVRAVTANTPMGCFLFEDSHPYPEPGTFCCSCWRVNRHIFLVAFLS